MGAFAMPNFLNFPPFTEDGDVHVVVETPRGSRAKFAYAPKLESFALSKSLLTGLTYPHDWGFGLAVCERAYPDIRPGRRERECPNSLHFQRAWSHRRACR